MPTTRRDPVPTFLFGFKITSGELALDYKDGTAFFKSVSGLKVTRDIQDYQEGGVTSFTRKLPGIYQWPNIVLSQGFTGDPKLFNYRMNPTRVNGIIVALSHKLVPICKWEFYNAYPVKWTGADLDTDKNELAIEVLELAHEGLVMNPEAPKKEDSPPPASPPPAPPVNASVNFPTDSSTVPSPSPALDAAADGLKKDPKKKVKIEGHTDSVGDAGYNKTLSQQRADAVKKRLLDSGTDPAQIVSCTGYGEDKPIADNNTAAGRGQNRRTTVDEIPS